MWMDDEDARLEEQNSKGLVKKFNSMRENASSVYFDVDQLEVIIDHYLERAKPDDALQAVNHGLSIFNDNHFLKLRKGQILVSLGEFEQGKKILDILLEADPENQEILFGLGMAYAQVKEPKRAISYFKKAYDQADHDLQAEVLVEIALQYQITGEPNKSLSCYEKALELGLNTDLVLREFRSCVKRNDLLLEGEQILQKHLDKNPYNAKVWFCLGMIKYDFGLLESAIDSYDFALAIKGDYAMVYYKKAEVLIKQEKYTLALESLFAEMKYRAPMALNYCIIADCYENLSEFKQAEEYYLKAIAVDEHFSEAYIGLGFLKEVQFDYLAAIPFYEKAVGLDEENYNAHLMLASVLSELEQFDRAKAVVRNLISIEEGLEEAWIELAFIYSKEENIERALSSVEEGIETAYSNEQLWLKKVVYLHKIGKRKEALELARELLVEDVSVKDTLSASGSDLLKDSEFVKLLSEF